MSTKMKKSYNNEIYLRGKKWREVARPLNEEFHKMYVPIKNY
jgi:hypothetical protein